MKKSLILLALAMTTLLAACGSSSSTPPPPPSAIGVWTGNVYVGTTPAPYENALLADGTIRGIVLASGSATTGTWTLTGSTVVMNFTFDVGGSAYTFTGTLTGSTLAGSGTGASAVTFSYARPTSTTSGIWKGKYGFGAGALTNDYLVLLFPSGFSEIHDGALLTSARAVGTWTGSAGAVSTDFTYVGSSSLLRILGSISGDTLTGTWGASPGGTSGGNLSLSREK